jgi:hypothetical protein
VTLAITVAVDHLQGLRLMVMGPPDGHVAELHLRTHAPFTLLRGTIENAAAAVWLLASTDSDQRALRAFRIGAKEVKNSEAVKALVGTAGPRTKDQRFDRIRDRARACGVDPKAAVSRVDYLEILREAAAPIGVRPAVAEAHWRICSALAHGDQWPAITSLGVVAEVRGASSVTREVVSNTEVLVQAAGLAVTLVEAALRLFGEQRKRP